VPTATQYVKQIQAKAEICKAYDTEYYINNQVIPAVERILDVLGYPSQVVLDEQQSRVGDF